MRRTLVLAVLGLVSLAAAAAAFLRRPPPEPLDPPLLVSGPLRITAELDRRYLEEGRPASSYLEVALTARADGVPRARVPVNAVLILDRSGSMNGEKIEQARAAARTLVEALGPSDRVAIVAFDTDAEVLVPSSAVTPQLKAEARRLSAGLRAAGDTNFSAAFDLAGGELAAGHLQGRVDEVFIASDGRVTDGELDLGQLMRRARTSFGRVTLSTFGIGEDYDEELMRGLAEAGGGRMQFIEDVRSLPAAFARELGRANRLVATDVRVRVTPIAGSTLERVFGYEPVAGQLRLPDFAAGDERRVLFRLAFAAGEGARDVASVEVAYRDAAGEPRTASAAAQAIFTAEASRLREPAGRPAVDGARAEMAELARKAALEQEAGQVAEAGTTLDTLGRLAASVPAPHLREEARLYAAGVSRIAAPGDAAAKSVKQKSFDAVRAPVAGW